MRDRVIRAGLVAGLVLVGLTLLAVDASAQVAPAEAPAPPPAWLPPVAAPTEAAADVAEEAAEADLMNELQEIESETTALQIYGFADLTYTRFLMDESSAWYDTYFSVHPTFAVGNLNLYLEKRIAPGWRSLIEFRLLYLPNGSEEISATTGEASRVDTTVVDYLDKQETLRWGGISIERAWVEYEVHPLVTVRAGHWLTPYGIWNVDHGSPVLIPIRRPFLIGQGLFPRSQTGLLVHGRRAFGDRTLTYQATVSNGRGPVDTYLDLDGNKAIGGRLTLDLPVLDELTLGASAYTGTYTARTRTYGLGGETVVADDDVTERYRELASGLDVRARSGPVVLNAEVIAREARYDDRARPRATTAVNEQQADFFAYGTYVLVGVRLPWWGLMPYVVGEYSHPMWAPTPHYLGGMLGINLRVAPTVTLKTQVQGATLPGRRGGLVPDDYILNWEAQIAWVF